MPVLWIHIFGTVTIPNKVDSCGFGYLISIETSDSEQNHGLSKTDCRPSGLQGSQIEYMQKKKRVIFLSRLPN